MNNFYRGVNEKYRLSLGTSSNEDFSTRMIKKAQILASNLAASDNNNHFSNSGFTHRHSQFKELKEIMLIIAKSLQWRGNTFGVENEYTKVNYLEAQGNY